MTDDDYQALSEATRHRDAGEKELQRRALRKRRAKWIWLALMPLVAIPVLLFAGLLIERSLEHLRVPFFPELFERFPETLLPPATLVWIGYCAAKIAALNELLSGYSASTWSRIAIFLGLLVIDILIALIIVFAGCAIMFPHGFGTP